MSDSVSNATCDTYVITPLTPSEAPGWSGRRTSRADLANYAFRPNAVVESVATLLEKPELLDRLGLPQSDFDTWIDTPEHSGAMH